MRGVNGDRDGNGDECGNGNSERHEVGGYWEGVCCRC